MSTIDREIEGKEVDAHAFVLDVKQFDKIMVTYELRKTDEGKYILDVYRDYTVEEKELYGRERKWLYVIVHNDYDQLRDYLERPERYYADIKMGTITYIPK